MKTKIPVYIETTATACIGHVEVETKAEFEKAAEALFQRDDLEEPDKFDLGEWELDYSQVNYYINKGKRDGITRDRI